MTLTVGSVLILVLLAAIQKYTFAGMRLNYLDAQILIAINQRNGDTVSSLATSLATDEISIEDCLRRLEKEGFVSRRLDAISKALGRIELTKVGRDYLIENDMYRSFRLI